MSQIKLNTLIDSWFIGFYKAMLSHYSFHELLLLFVIGKCIHLIIKGDEHMDAFSLHEHMDAFSLHEQMDAFSLYELQKQLKISSIRTLGFLRSEP